MNLAAWQPASRPLPALLAGMTSAELPQLTVTGVESDSRRLGPGQLFLACPGERHHGSEFIREAVGRGAAAVAWDGDQPPPSNPGVPAVRIPGLAARVGDIAARYYGHPSQGLFVVGVTGTDGKTSCVHLLAQALASLGRPCGCLGTLGYGMLPQLEPASHTTPDPIRVQEWLARFAAGSAQDVAMEVSSHALVQNRVRGVCFNVAVLTNIGRDHLDYHADIGAYRAAKRRLFEMPGLEQAILNSDDPVGAHWLRSLPAGVEPIAYGLQARGAGAARYLQASDIQTHVHGLSVEIDSSWGGLRLTSGLLGRFNAHNLLAVLAVLLVSGVEPAAAVRALGQAQTVPGRMDVVGRRSGRPLVVVDYAHTPNALAHALAALREHSAGRVYCAFGCGGERDPGKRPLMGKAAGRLADALWITDDNPRGEDPAAIVADILAGIPARAAATVEHDRAAAIAAAIAAAGPDDAVLIAGKGHETTQQIGSERRSFSDAAAARRALGAA